MKPRLFKYLSFPTRIHNQAICLVPNLIGKRDRRCFIDALPINLLYFICDIYTVLYARVLLLSVREQTRNSFNELSTEK
jgi:hypothetical protein